MPKQSQAEMENTIRLAALYFVTETRDAKIIAEKVNASERTIHRWSKSPVWIQTLDTLGYTGERNFRVRQGGRKKKGE
jgi:hypothetical protein